MHVNVDGTVCAGTTNTIKLAGSGCLFVLVKIMIVASHIKGKYLTGSYFTDFLYVY